MKTPDNGVPITRVDGLSHIEIVGADGLFCLYENRRVAGTDKVIMIPKRDILMPLRNLPDAITKSLAVTAKELAGKFCHWLPVSMH